MGFASRKLLAKSKKKVAPLPLTGDLYWSDVALFLRGEGSNNQSNNSFLDSSSNNFTITRNGSVTQGSFTPFLNNFAYDPLIHGGSGYFNGTTDYLTSSSTTISNFGTNPFTVECWAYKTGTNQTAIYDGRPTGSASVGFAIAVNANNTFNIVVGSSTIFTSTATMNLNSWNHIAVSRSSALTNGCSLYLNGVNIGTFTISQNIDNGFNVIGAVSYTPLGNAPWNGYISNFRITKGAALYTSNFTPPTSPVTLTSNGGATPSTAPTSGQVSLLCNFTNGGIVDTTKKNNLTTVGDTKVSTSVKKYGSGSIYFDGTGDYSTIPSGDHLNFRTGLFTIESWFYPTASASQTICGKWANLSQDNWLCMLTSGNAIQFYYLGGNISGGTFLLNTWNHYAVTRDSSNVIRLFLNGSQVATVTSAFDSNTTYQVEVGSYANGGNRFTGYIDDLRITKGVARYTSNFTPPQQALPVGPSTTLIGLELNDFSGYIIQEDSSYILLDT